MAHDDLAPIGDVVETHPPLTLGARWPLVGEGQQAHAQGRYRVLHAVDTALAAHCAIVDRDVRGL